MRKIKYIIIYFALILSINLIVLNLITISGNNPISIWFILAANLVLFLLLSKTPYLRRLWEKDVPENIDNTIDLELQKTYTDYVGTVWAMKLDTSDNPFEVERSTILIKITSQKVGKDEQLYVRYVYYHDQLGIWGIESCDSPSEKLESLSRRFDIQKDGK